MFNLYKVLHEALGHLLFRLWKAPGYGGQITTGLSSASGNMKNWIGLYNLLADIIGIRFTSKYTQYQSMQHLVMQKAFTE